MLFQLGLAIKYDTPACLPYSPNPSRHHHRGRQVKCRRHQPAACGALDYCTPTFKHVDHGEVRSDSFTSGHPAVPYRRRSLPSVRVLLYSGSCRVSPHHRCVLLRLAIGANNHHPLLGFPMLVCAGHRRPWCCRVAWSTTSLLLACGCCCR
jgi:hypothetical protein